MLFHTSIYNRKDSAMLDCQLNETKGTYRIILSQCITKVNPCKIVNELMIQLISRFQKISMLALS